MVPSKHDPTMDAGRYAADRREKPLDEDGFKKWGFVIYRCTYQNNTDRQNFMDHFVSAAPGYLEFYNGLDLLDTFTPTVLEDPSFEGATVDDWEAYYVRPPEIVHTVSYKGE
ncbi:hypothetical protein EN45_013480 [Penicillium chrysogenum]|jgi:hypothetical protein|nr:hypothetical protein NUH16_001062 [Penicillium rubens]KZN91219.1 hypothetical protein EN45_013480 [Penicillium chrysogenum]